MEPPKNNTQTEEDDTIALKKKRARRVSFSEITSVHVFRRDDDSSSPSDAPLEPSVPGFFRDLATDSDDEEEQPHLDDDADAGNSFLRPIGSPSPGGSSTADDADAADADADDEDDFHGPVSACFIRPDRLSDSGVSDDVTMDSTAFSMHYRSIAQSDSGDIKTRQFGFTTPSPHGSSMDLTEAKKAYEEAADAESGGRDSNDMSIEGEHGRSYSYDRLSPAFDALLAEGGKNSPNVLVKGLPDAQCNLEGWVASPVNQVHQVQASDSSIKEIKEFAKDATVPLFRQLSFANANAGTPLKVDEDRGQVFDFNQKHDHINQNPIHGSMPSSFSGRKQLYMTSPDSSRYNGDIFPPLKQSDLFGPEVRVTENANQSSVSKSILKTKTLETTPSISSLKEGIDKLKCRLSIYSPGISLSNKKDNEYKQVESHQTPLKEKLFSLSPENNMDQGLVNSDDCRIQSSKSISKSSQNIETVGTNQEEENLNLISAYLSYSDEISRSVEMATSPSQMTNLMSVLDVDLVDGTVEKRKDGILVVLHDEPYSSPVKLFDQSLSPSGGRQNNCHDEMKQVNEQNESVDGGLGQAIECNSQPVANKLEFSGLGNSEQRNSPFDVAQVNEFAKSASKRKLNESPNRILVLSTPIQEVTQLHSLQIPASVPDFSPKGNSVGHCLDNSYHPILQVAQSPFTKSDIEISSGKKRKGLDVPSDGDNTDKLGRIGISPDGDKNGKGDLKLVLDKTGYTGSEKEKLGDQTRNDWDLILKTFLASTNQLLSPSVDKLNLRSIGRLEDVLVHLQKIKKSEILFSEIQSQHKLKNPVNIPRDERVAEARKLLYDIAYEKAKLQLMHMKQDKLLKKVQQLSTALKESEGIKLNLIPSSSSKNGTMGTQTDSNNFHTTLLSSQGKYQVSCKKVIEMRKELETLDSKAKSLSEFLFRYCKMEGDQSCCTNTIRAVSSYLQKRMSCKSIFQNLKLWDIQDFKRKDGCYVVCLNYCGYVTQRITVNTGLSSIIISNMLNDVNIGKAFQNLDAISAFMFVLNPHSTKKCIGSINLARETQITSSLLSNLLNVVEEVQSTRIEISNLIEAKFYSPSVWQLDLQLSFIDFCSGRKVKVTLDMTCLQSGAYPLEVLPSQVCDPSFGERKSLPSSLADEINSAAESVRVGHSRIIRLCRRISQAVQACTRGR